MGRKSKKKQVGKGAEPSGTPPVTPESTQPATTATGATQTAITATGATQTATTVRKSSQPSTSANKTTAPLTSTSMSSQPSTSARQCTQPLASPGWKKQGRYDEQGRASASTQPSRSTSTSVEYKPKSDKKDYETGSNKDRPLPRSSGVHDNSTFRKRDDKTADNHSSLGGLSRPYDHSGRGRGRGGGFGRGQQEFRGGPKKPGEFPPSGGQNRPRFQQQSSSGGGGDQWPSKQQQWPWKDTKQQQQEAPSVSHEQPKRGKDFGIRGAASHGAPDQVQAPSTSLERQSKQELSEPSTSTVQSGASLCVFKKPGKPGTLARKIIKVQSNHFALLNLNALKDAYHYHVDITDFDKEKKSKQKTPETSQSQTKNKPKKIKNKLFYKVVEKFLEKHFPTRFPSYDGQHSLYASKPLTGNLHEEIIDNDITIVDSLGKPKNFGIKIKWVATISLVLQQEAGTSLPPILTDKAKQCLDVILRNAPMRRFNQIGPCFFRQPIPDKIIDLGAGMEMYYGFYQSVVNGGRPYLNVHLVHKAFPKNLPVLDAFVEILCAKDNRNKYTYNNLTSLQPWQRNALNEYIRNLKVLYEITQMKRIYKVNGLAGTPSEETVTIDNMGKVTIQEYYKQRYDYNIKHPNIPLLHVGNIQGNIRILIPPELCRIEKDQSVKKKMEDFQKRNMIQEAATDTRQHRMNVMQRFKDAGYNDSDHVRREFGFSVSDKFEIMNARVLPTPKLQYKGEDYASVFKGTWTNKKFLDAKTIEKWAIVNVSNDKFVNRRVIDSFIMELKNAARECGIGIKDEPYVNTIEGQGRYPPRRVDIKGYFENAKTKNYDIIFVIVPGSEQGNASTYSVVKCVAELEFGCLTQCVKASTLTKKFNLSTAKNILLKVNGKLDGINHTFTNQCKPKILDDYVMIMGADVTHPGRDETMPSIAAVIASHDPKAFQYNVCWRLQKGNLEDIVDLKDIVKKQLDYYFKKNGVKPEKIIFFRDGVSEGQFMDVLNKELTAIKDACKEIGADYNPAVTFLVVQKRHHTRLFPLNGEDSEDPNKNCNVPAGTCVDTTIVDPTIENFYLVSHASIKGVARPTKYCTLYDDLDLTNDEIQELSYYLCHMFARCTRSVSYPAPTYYAHLAALRGKAYIKPEVDSNRFDINNLQREMAARQIQDNILLGHPMFFI